MLILGRELIKLHIKCGRERVQQCCNYRSSVLTEYEPVESHAVPIYKHFHTLLQIVVTIPFDSSAEIVA